MRLSVLGKAFLGCHRSKTFWRSEIALKRKIKLEIAKGIIGPKFGTKNTK